MKEVICFHVGQAGVQIGEELWNSYMHSLKTGVEGCGLVDSPTTTASVDEKKDSELILERNVLFDESMEGRWIPRCVLVDAETGSLDRIKKTHRHFHESFMVSTKEEAANNFATAKYNLGRSIQGDLEDVISSIVECCDDMQGFLLFHAVGGGIGSGITSLLSEYLASEFPKMIQTNFPIWPSPNISNCIVEPYNSVLAIESIIRYSDLTAIFDNEKLFRIAEKQLGSERPTFQTINQLVSYAVELATRSLYSTSTVNKNLHELKHNLVPNRPLHFCVMSCAPLCSATRYNSIYSFRQLFSMIQHPSYTLSSCDVRKGTYLRSSLNFLGDISDTDRNNCVSMVKRKLGISESSLTAGCCPYSNISRSLPITVPATSLLLTSTSTAVLSAFKNIRLKFEKLFKKKAFLHWYIDDGAQLDEFQNAREALMIAESFYNSEVGTQTSLL